MAYGEPFATSCEAKVDYSGIIIFGLLDDVFKTMIFSKMCNSMDNATLLNFLCGWKFVVTLALGSRPRQGLVKVRAKCEGEKSHIMLLGMWESEGMNPHTPN
jgi:hypothetical protein